MTANNSQSDSDRAVMNWADPLDESRTRDRKRDKPHWMTAQHALLFDVGRASNNDSGIALKFSSRLVKREQQPQRVCDRVAIRTASVVGERLRRCQTSTLIYSDRHG